MAEDGTTRSATAPQTIALVGENGSGKTTVARLLAVLWAPDAGVVRWDGEPVDELPRDALRRHIAVVGQEVLQWPFTARENIQVGDVERVDADGGRAVAAAVAVGADAMIRGLTHGYDTLLDRTFVGGRAYRRRRPVRRAVRPAGGRIPSRGLKVSLRRP